MIQEIQEPQDQRYREVSAAVEKWLKWHENEDFTFDDIRRYHSWTERQTKEALSKKLYYEANKPKPRLRKRGRVYRVINKELEPMNLRINGTRALDLSWPFGLERFVKILPKNIIIIGGSKSAGKTTFVLDFINKNMNKFQISYFNSEMGEEELVNRMKNFNELRPYEWRFKAYMRSSDFADVIDPAGANIVDFLEVYEDFFKIGYYVKEIWERLTTGIALIVIQKNEGAEYPLGRERALEKARLVLNLDRHSPVLRAYHLLTIFDAKNWADGLTESPRGMKWAFKIVGGAKFVDVQELGKGGE